ASLHAIPTHAAFACRHVFDAQAPLVGRPSTIIIVPPRASVALARRDAAVAPRPVGRTGLHAFRTRSAVPIFHARARLSSGARAPSIGNTVAVVVVPRLARILSPRHDAAPRAPGPVQIARLQTACAWSGVAPLAASTHVAD